ncbi:MAG: hypothetical protein ACI4KM_12175 [Oscillospiraceae bacterium]
MPHSSGGGSHGGGFHGGSHRGGSGGRSVRISRNGFAGARRFMYYVQGTPRYVYLSEPLKEQSVLSLVVQLIFLGLFVFLGLYMLFSGISMIMPPKPLTPNAAYEQYHIEDTLDVIDNEPELEIVLKEYQSKTGICPYILTVDRGIWANKFSSLENYAYETYLRKFSDEKHFLIVYSATGKGSDWNWEGMQGNDTDPILTEGNMEKFNRKLYYSLESGIPVGMALRSAFEDSFNYLMKSSGGNIVESLTTIVFGLIWLLFCVLAIVKAVREYIFSRITMVEAPIEGDRSDESKYTVD